MVIEKLQSLRSGSRLIGVGLYAGHLLIRSGLKLSGRSSEDFHQTRIGRGGAPFIIRKLLTLDGDTPHPLSGFHSWARDSGADELAQGWNMMRGEMVFDGWRALEPDEHQEFLETIGPFLAVYWQAGPG